MARTDERADAQLLAATSRDPEAFAVFYRRYAELILAYFLNRTARRDIAADLTAETFAAALAGAARVRGGRENAAGWLFGTAARNKLIDSFRRGQVEDRSRRELGLEPVARRIPTVVRRHLSRHGPSAAWLFAHRERPGGRAVLLCRAGAVDSPL